MNEQRKISIPLREQIRKDAPANVAKVHVPEWGKDVWVRGLTAEEFYQIVEADDSAERLWDTVAAYTVDEQGKRAFKDDDIDWLKTQPATALQRIVTKVRELNTISTKKIEDTEKN